jgi:hypothetical protein
MACKSWEFDGDIVLLYRRECPVSGILDRERRERRHSGK